MINGTYRPHRRTPEKAVVIPTTMATDAPASRNRAPPPHRTSTRTSQAGVLRSGVEAPHRSRRPPVAVVLIIDAGCRASIIDVLAPRGARAARPSVASAGGGGARHGGRRRGCGAGACPAGRRRGCGGGGRPDRVLQRALRRGHPDELGASASDRPHGGDRRLLAGLHAPRIFNEETF